MKWTPAAAGVAVLSLAFGGNADGKRCIKSAVVGGVAGHGMAGAAAGCVIGDHETNKPDPNNADA
ncbi:MAG: hypothetical protein WCB02_24020 [Bradyrhizobium sp.]